MYIKSPLAVLILKKLQWTFE